jgi:hypothetical protein
MTRRRWSDLSSAQQRAIIVGGVVEVVVTALAVRDLARRPSGQVRGPKAGWLLSFVVSAVWPVGVLRRGSSTRRLRGVIGAPNGSR